MTRIEIDHAVAYLRQHSANRDPGAGLWLTADGLVLASDPLESAQLLRRALVSEHYRRTTAARPPRGEC